MAASLFIADHFCVGVLLALAMSVPQLLRNASPPQEILVVALFICIVLVVIGFFRFDTYRHGLILDFRGDQAFLADRTTAVRSLRKVWPAGTVVGVRLVDAQGEHYYAPLRWRVPRSIRAG